MGQTLCRNTPVTWISAWMSVHELAALCAHSMEENRLLVVVIYTFLPAADINVRNSIVIVPFLHSPPSLLFSLAQPCIIVWKCQFKSLFTFCNEIYDTFLL